MSQVLSIRMRIAPDWTLNGYVFSDVEHAKKWLSQPFVNPDAVKLELVRVGELKLCNHCGGFGYNHSVRKIRDVSVADVLSGIDLVVASEGGLG